MSWHAVLAIALLVAPASGDEIVIPEAMRIPARVTHHLAAPAEDAMHMPTDVAVNDGGRAFVADGALDRILIFSADGGLEASLETVGGHRLHRPVGLTLDAVGRLWIADTGNHRVLVVAAGGDEVEVIEVPSDARRRPFNPTDIAVTRDGARAYIVDNDNHRVAVRDNVGRTWTMLGSFGEAIGQFRWPFMVVIGLNDYVYVTEAIGGRVQRISPEDRWAGQVGRWGVELGQLYRPKGIAVDARGRLYVSDSTLGVVQVFTHEGRFVGVPTYPDGTPWRFDHPMGLWMTPDGRLYVTELRENRVAVLLIDDLAGSNPATTRPAGQERE